MSFSYINEAFKRLDALNEDMFDTSLTGLNNLADFQDQDDASDIVKVIDPTAETEDAISDSYIGKVIINCNVCHSHIFETKEDVVIDEDGVVNPEMQCPYCGESLGFTVVGEIKPFEQESEESVDTADTQSVQDEASATDETDDQENSENQDEDKLEESFNLDTATSDIDTLKSFLRSKGYSCQSKEAITYLWGVIDLFDAGNQEFTTENIEQWYNDTLMNFPEDLDLLESIEEDTLKEGALSGGYASGGSLDTHARPGGSTQPSKKSYLNRLKSNNPDLVDIMTVKGKDIKPGMITQAGQVKEATIKYSWEHHGDAVYIMHTNKYDGFWGTDEDMEVLVDPDNKSKPFTGSYKELLDKGLKESTTSDESTSNGMPLEEEIQDLSMTANDTHVEMSEDENGKVTLTVEPSDGTTDAEETDDTMDPVSDETVDELASNNDIELEDEDAAEGEESEGEEVDVDMDEVDEEGLDELGESYLKNIYENVDSFKTTSVSTTDSEMIVEGVITFQSGTKKNTGFVFEAYSASRDGKVKFFGKNEHFSPNKRAFSLTGKISNKKLLPESLSYNYQVGSRKIAGTVNKQ